MDYKRLYLKEKEDYFKLKNQTGGQEIGPFGSFPLIDEVYFWSRQMLEHMLIIHLAMTMQGEKLKIQSKELENEWKNFLKNNFYSKGIENVVDQIFLSEKDISKVNLDRESLNVLLDKTLNFNDELVRILESNEWVGWLYPSVAKHMKSEVEYFIRKVNGPAYKLEEEIQFCNQHNSEEIGATAQMLDPRDQGLIDIARSYALKEMSRISEDKSLSGTTSMGKPFPKKWSKSDESILKGLDKGEQVLLLKLSIDYGTELTNFAADTAMKIDQKNLSSIISPILAHHVYREFYRFSQTLKALQQKK